jgi:hypothetical protein
MADAAPMYNKPANWKKFKPSNGNLQEGMAIPKRKPERIPVIMAKHFIKYLYSRLK